MLKTVLFFMFTILTLALFATQAALAPTPLLLEESARHIDDVCMQNLAILERIAASPAATEGKWLGIKQQLEMIPERFPGVWFYVLPDGNYYSLERDYTNLNLKDRGYFESLFSGNRILGYPIFSRSTGKKSAVMAAPIIVDGKVTGAMGLSVYLDELHSRINDNLGIIGNFTWFTVNSDGLTMLDMDSDYIFMNTLTEAPPSMSRSISQALMATQGEISYDLGEVQRIGRFHKLPNLPWWLIIARKDAKESSSASFLELSLKDFVPQLQQSLDELVALALSKSEVPSASWDQEPYIRPILKSLIDANPLIVDAAFVDSKGIMRYIEPSLYKNFEGVDISEQEHVRTWLKQAKPQLGEAFISEEGFWAVSLAFPVKNDKGLLQGGISLLIRPDLMIGRILSKSSVPPQAELVVMDTRSRLLYDDDPKEIGLLLFEDPLYQEYDSLLRLGKEMLNHSSGKGDYVFESRGNSQKVLKTATWESVKIMGTEWRVLLAQARN